MSAAALSSLVQRAARAVAPEPAETPGQLLARFVRSREDRAFAGLVRQLGPMVLGVCRRVAGDHHLAEDAFQAAFLVLSRRAADVRPPEAVRGWLYGVAVRTAQEARTVAARQRRREAPVAQPPDRAAELAHIPDSDALRALDEEIAALPEHLRAAVALCELEGRSRKDAADRLGVAEGTLSSRLAKARTLLAGRLRKRGVALPAAGFGALLAGAPVSAGLATTTSALAAPDVPPAPAAAALSNGVVKSMFAQKLKIAVPLVALAVGALACIALAVEHDPQEPAQPRVVFASRAAPVPKAAPREGTILITGRRRPGPTIRLLTPAGEELPAPALGGALASINPGDVPTCTLCEGRLSPDGRRMAAFKLGPIPQNLVGPWTPFHLWVFDLDAKDGPREPLLTDVRDPSAVFSPDGTKLYVSRVDPDKVPDPRKDDEPVPLLTWVYDLKTNKQMALALPRGHRVIDVSPDGKTLLTVTSTSNNPFTSARSYVVPLGGLKPRPLSDRAFQGFRFSPDGKQVLGVQYGERLKGYGSPALLSVAVANGTEKPIAVPANAARIGRACWSPDGTRIAYEWHAEVVLPSPNANPTEEFVCRVTVADADGRSARTVYRTIGYGVYGLDWK